MKACCVDLMDLHVPGSNDACICLLSLVRLLVIVPFPDSLFASQVSCALGTFRIYFIFIGDRVGLVWTVPLSDRQIDGCGQDSQKP